MSGFEITSTILTSHCLIQVKYSAITMYFALLPSQRGEGIESYHQRDPLITFFETEPGTPPPPPKEPLAHFY